MSNHDHGVSVFSFLDDGTMLVSVGAVTNAGVPAPGMGGSQETPLSAAIIQARYLEPGFNGQVMYSKWNESDQVTADQIGGDVSVYAAGLRSCFGISRSLKGVLYATDNGANTGFGPMSTSCSTSGEEPNVPDSLYVINKGNYYGHPNRNRARYDERQCAWHGNGSTPSIAHMTSSTNGVLAYSGNAFGGQLKNTLFLTKMAWFGQPGKTLRADLSIDGKSITDGPYEIWGDSGLSLVQGAAGELVMPQLKSKRVLVLVPEDGAAAGSVRMASGPEVHYVHPPRGHASGGVDVLVTGRGFEDVVSVRLGEAACTDVRVLSETMLRCRTPAGVGSVTMSVTTSSGLASSSTGIDFAYAGATLA
jgi:IPT/TIG domain/Glucose / Sorbosone dehydrogenase